MVALEQIREMIGVNPCDKRRATHVLREEFPWIDFGAVTADADELWKADHRETSEEITARARRFMLWLRERDERVIAVVSHSAFLTSLFATMLGQRDVYFHHGELKSVVW